MLFIKIRSDKNPVRLLSLFVFSSLFSLVSCTLQVPEGMTDKLRSVSYSGNGNTTGSAPVDSKTYVKGLTATILGNTGGLARSLIVFGRWNTRADGTGKDYLPGDSLTIGDSDITLYARWSPVYTITYNANNPGGTGAAPVDSKLYVNSATATILSNSGTLTKPANVFVGWNTQADGLGVRYQPGAAYTTGGANMVLYAQWAAAGTVFNVTYSGNGNTGGSSPTDGNNYLPGDLVTLTGSGSLVKTGFGFVGWNTMSDGSGTTYQPGNTFSIAANQTLYALWAGTYTVTYNDNGKDGGAVPVDAGAYTTGTTVTVLGNTGTLVKTGYFFAGWNTQANGLGTDRSAGSTFAMGTSNVTLYAKWSLTVYHVSYNGNSSTSGSVPVDGNNYNNGNTVTVLGNTGSLLKTGFIFTGWNTQANGSGNAYSASNTFNIALADVTLYAQWQAVFTVVYNGNTNDSGSVPVDGLSPYSPGATVTVLGNTGSLVKTSCPFGGWNTQADGLGTTYAPAGSFTIGVTNIVLYAVWNCPTYTVTYNGNGGTGSAPNDLNQYASGSSVTILANSGGLTQTGFAFVGWNTLANGSGTTYQPGATFSIVANTALYAKWATTYTVTYNANTAGGGSVPVDGTGYLPGATVSVPGNIGVSGMPAVLDPLTKVGYAFVGWNTQAGGGGTNYVSGNTFVMGSAPVILYAKWAQMYLVTYDTNGANGGTVPASPTYYLPGATVSVFANSGNLTKTANPSGFNVWNDSSLGTGNDVGFGTNFSMPATNVTLYPKWLP
jgi:uncharacterized repeat protein (TIGR02543 family)